MDPVDPLQAIGDQLPAPYAPIIDGPAPGDEIGSPLLVAGRGIPGARIQLAVLSGARAIGEAIAVVGDDGVFLRTVNYIEPRDNTGLLLKATQSQDGLTSKETVVPLDHAALPAEPTIASPEPGEDVARPVRVSGTGTPGLLYTVRIEQAGGELATLTATVGPDGRFVTALDFDPPAMESDLEVFVHQTNAVGSSEATRQRVIYSPRLVRGAVEQDSGSMDGDAVYVRLYDTADVYADALAEQRLPATPGQPFVGRYRFSVADGTYYVRAFRDSTGRDGAADGEPSLPGDAQSVRSPPIRVHNAHTSGHDLDLRDVSDSARMAPMEIFTSHETGRAHAAGGEDSGVCGGYRVVVRARVITDRSPSAPVVKLPDGRQVGLHDDGGCGEAADNRSHSYDRARGDGEYTFGLPDPRISHAGAYRMMYRDPRHDSLHVETVTMSSLVRLDRAVTLTSPDASSAVERQPALKWPTVYGATHYTVEVRSSDGEVQARSPVLTETVWTPDAPLADDASYTVIVDAYDADPTTETQRAHARLIPARFIVDEDRDSSIVVSGAIFYAHKTDRPIHITTIDERTGRPQSSVRLPPGTDAYWVRALRGEEGTLSVEAFVDEELCGEMPGQQEATPAVRIEKLDARGNVTADVRFDADSGR